MFLRSILLGLVLAFWGVSGVAHFQATSTSGVKIHWTSGIVVPLNVIPACSWSTMSEGDTVELVRTSANAWNDHSSITVNADDSFPGTSSGRNDLSFVSDLGSGILGMTRVAYEESSGRIVEADILINDDFTYSDDPLDTDPEAGINMTSPVFLGDIATHEIGHLLGLAHGLVHDSTMIFTLSRGQSTLAEVDKSGLYAIYPSGGLGRISGTVIGGAPGRFVDIFGAHVQAISSVTGRSAGAALSQSNGTFNIDGLIIGETYYLYVSPSNRDASLPLYYDKAEDNFCEAGNYTGVFFSKCANNGYPQGVHLSSSVVDVGNVTIGCAHDSPSDYITAKKSVFSLPMNIVPGNAFVGYFLSPEKSSGQSDMVRIDLTSYTPLHDEYLEIKIVSQHLFSDLRTKLKVNGTPLVEDGTFVEDGIIFDADNKADVDPIVRVALGTDKIFEIQIEPMPDVLHNLENFGDLESFFPSHEVFLDSRAFYLLIASIVRKNSDNSWTTVHEKSYVPLSDNTACPMASKSYAVSVENLTGSTALTLATSRTENRKGFFSCGTVSLSGGHGPPGDGPISFLGGFLLPLFIVPLLFSKRKTSWIRALLRLSLVCRYWGCQCIDTRFYRLFLFFSR